MSKYKKYDKSFKQRAVQLALTSDQPTSKTAQDLGILESTLYNWISKAKRDKDIPEANNEAPDVKQLHDELLKLRKENQRLRDTCDILKKPTVGSIGQCIGYYSYLDCRGPKYEKNVYPSGERRCI